MRFGLDQVLLDKFCAVFEQYSSIDKVIIYGSRAKGSYRKGSDVDLTLLGPEITFETLSAVIIALDVLNTPYLVDVSLFSELHSLHLEEHILRVGQVFYQKDTSSRA